MTELEAATIVKLAWADFPNSEITPEVIMKFHDVLREMSYVDAREAVSRIGKAPREFPPSAGLVWEENRSHKLRFSGNGIYKSLPEPSIPEDKRLKYCALLSHFSSKLDIGGKHKTEADRIQIQQAAMETIEAMRELRNEN